LTLEPFGYREGSKQFLAFKYNMDGSCSEFHIGVDTGRNSKYTSEKKKKTDRSYFRISHFTFEPYNGPRWEVPSGIKVSPSVRYKFEKCSTCKITEVFSKIHMESTQNVYNLQGYANPWNLFNSDFSKIPKIKSYLTSLRDKDVNEWKKVASIYHKLFKVVRFMNKLVNLRRFRICLKKQINTEDIVTLEVPRKPVYVVNFSKRCTYVYEAETLRRTINNKLLTSEWMFENPQYPLNILSNEPLTTGQCISIYNQLKSYGVFSWIFDRFRSCDFCLNKFKMRFRPQLKVEAIESHFRNEIENSKETVMEFFEANAIDYGMIDDQIAKFKDFFHLCPNAQYIQTLRSMAKRYYIAYELHDIPTVTLISLEVKRYIDRYLNEN